MKKSSRHSKITGDFGEVLVLYWLSKNGYECAWVDHIGIDVIAIKKDGSERMGISVQCRSCYPGAETRSVTVHEFEKARPPCDLFELIPHGAIVVDGGDVIRCFLVPLDHLETIVRGKTRQFLMTEPFLKKCRDDPKIRFFELAWRTGSSIETTAPPSSKKEVLIHPH
jgi:hypothetical protein